MTENASPVLPPSAYSFQAMGEKRFAASKYDLAAKLFASTILGGGYSDFLTTLCNEHILSTTGKAKPLPFLPHPACI